MSEFMITYHGGNVPQTKEEGQKAMAEWKAWATSLGEALTNPGTPVGKTKVLTSKGVSNEPSPNPLMGFSIVEAANIEAALDLIKDCPHLKYEGTLEVSEMLKMTLD